MPESGECHSRSRPGKISRLLQPPESRGEIPGGIDATGNPFFVKSQRHAYGRRTAELRRGRSFVRGLKNESTEELREMVRQEVEMLKELELNERRAELQEPQSDET